MHRLTKVSFAVIPWILMNDRHSQPPATNEACIRKVYGERETRWTGTPKNLNYYFSMGKKCLVYAVFRSACRAAGRNGANEPNAMIGIQSRTCIDYSRTSTKRINWYDFNECDRFNAQFQKSLVALCKFKPAESQWLFEKYVDSVYIYQINYKLVKISEWIWFKF